MKKYSWKKRFILLLVIELCIVAAAAGILMINRRNLVKEVSIPALSSWSSEYVQYSGTDWHVDEGQIEGINSSNPIVVLAQSPEIALPKGHYTIEIWYDCDHIQSAVPTADNKDDVFVKASAFSLDHFLTHESYEFSTTESIKDFVLQLQYNGEGSFSVTNVQIVQNSVGLRMALLYLISAFLLVDAVLLYLHLPKEKKTSVWIVLAIAGLTSLPLLYRGVNDLHHDLAFHLMRIEGLAQELQIRTFSCESRIAVERRLRLSDIRLLWGYSAVFSRNPAPLRRNRLPRL